MFDLQRTLELIDDGALDEAVSALQRAIAQMPAYTPAYVLLAETYEALGRWSDALATWQQARFFAPSSPTVEAGLLRALDHQGIVPHKVADDTAPDVTPDDAMERMTDELLGTLQVDVHDDTAGRDGPAPPPGTAEPDSPASPAQDTPTAPPSARDDEPVEGRPDTAEHPSTDPVEPPAPPHLSPDEPGSEATPSEALDPDQERDAESGADEEGTPAEAPGGEAASVSDAPEPPSAHPRPSPLDELARRQPSPDQPLPEDLRDLDRLIDELEGARIDPQPDVGDVPEPDLDSDVDDMVSETLARIYIAQNQYIEAARVYVRLAHQDPDRADEYRERAAELREQARDANQ